MPSELNHLSRRDRLPSDCTFSGCTRRRSSKGLCDAHYRQMKRGAELAPIRAKRADHDGRVRDGLGRKFCPECSVWKDVSDFQARVSGADGLANRCKVCTRWYRVLQDFNLDRSDYLDRLERQGGACAICQALPPEGEFLCIDHSHDCCPQAGRSCGECVRGLLCNECNSAIGFMRDDASRLRRAVQYLEEA